MLQLLKIYGKKFTKDSFYLFVLVWTLGFIIKYINANAENLSSILQGLFFGLYTILFLFSYPLSSCLKWVLYTPIPKYKIVLFNLIFQIYKILLTFLLFSIMVLVTHFMEIQQSPNPQLPMGISSEWAEIAQKITQSMNFSIYESSIIFGLTLCILFVLAIIFGPSPKMMLEGRALLISQKRDYYYLLKKYKRYLIFIFPAAFVLKFLNGYWSSPLFISSTGIAYIIFAIFWSYADKLLATQKTKRVIYISAPLLLCGNVAFTYLYSQRRLQNEDKNMVSKVSEIIFQKHFHPSLSKTEMVQMLQSRLSAQEIISLMEIYRYHQKGPQQMNSPSNIKKIWGFPVFAHDFAATELDFQKVISSKENHSALQAALGLFKLQQLKFAEIVYFINHWKKIKQKNHKNYYPRLLAERLQAYPFQKQQLMDMLKSKNNDQHFLAIKLALHFKNMDLSSAIIENVMDYDTEILALAARTVSSLQCRTISSIEMVQMKAKNEKFLSRKCASTAL